MVRTASRTRRTGTLGSELTFAGQATLALVAQLGYDEPAYFPTMDDVVAAVLDGSVDIGVLTSETSRTACTETVARILAGERLFVSEEVIVPYRCALLGKPGARIDAIRHVGGHGSIRQCGAFLRERLPQATVEIHAQNSVEAAREVLAGDGSSAVIATEATASALGLEILASNVDGGSEAGWWGLTAALEPRPDADHLVARLEGSEHVEQVLARLPEWGLRTRTLTNAPTGELFHYRYLLVAHSVDGAPVGDGVVELLGPALVGLFASRRLP